MDDLKNFRQCLGKFATGVSVVSCRDENGKTCGITVNSFSSVSLEPPLVLWNAAKSSASLASYLAAEYFGISLLSTAQQEIAVGFATSGNGIFEPSSSHSTANGVPLINDALATFECKHYKNYECGDHHIIIGEVIDFRSSDRDPLLFFGGQYTGLKNA